MLNRRHFCASGLAISAATRLLAQSSRINVAEVERTRILTEADAALKLPPRPLTRVTPAKPGSKPQDFVSEPELLSTTPAKPFRAHAEALLCASASIAALTAAFVLTSDARYALHAGKHLYAWFVDDTTRMSPGMPALVSPGSVCDLAPLAELARAMPFLVDTPALYPPDWATAHAWFRDFYTWLDTARPALIAREAKDHTGSAHLLLCAVTARLLRDTAALTALANRFKRPTQHAAQFRPACLHLRAALHAVLQPLDGRAGRWPGHAHSRCLSLPHAAGPCALALSCRRHSLP